MGRCNCSSSQQKDGREENGQDLRWLTVSFSDDAPSSRVLRPEGDDDSRDLGVAIVGVAPGKDGREFPMLRLLTVRSLDM